MIQDSFKILTREEIAPGVLDYTISCPALCALAAPGQFVHLAVPGRSLRRPISICGVDRPAGELRLVFEVRGGGTALLARRMPGDTLDVLGPLGHGWELLDTDRRAIVVGGGIGTPPLLPLAAHYGRRCNAILGFRSHKNVILDLDYAGLCDTTVCTDDGSWGVEGTVAPALEAALQGCCPDIVYACGPAPMLKSVAALCDTYGVRCQLSLEERMACGVGACLGCAVKVRRRAEDGREEETFVRACKEGPVFEARDVVFE